MFDRDFCIIALWNMLPCVIWKIYRIITKILTPFFHQSSWVMNCSTCLWQGYLCRFFAFGLVVTHSIFVTQWEQYHSVSQLIATHADNYTCVFLHSNYHAVSGLQPCQKVQWNGKGILCQWWWLLFHTRYKPAVLQVSHTHPKAPGSTHSASYYCRHLFL